MTRQNGSAGDDTPLNRLARGRQATLAHFELTVHPDAHKHAAQIHLSTPA